jgi:hypothetical protein
MAACSTPAEHLVDQVRLVRGLCKFSVKESRRPGVYSTDDIAGSRGLLRGGVDHGRVGTLLGEELIGRAAPCRRPTSVAERRHAKRPSRG